MASFRSHLVILAGGSGTRFWPKSTSRRPKQLLSFGDSIEGGKTLLEQTLARFDGIVPNERRWIVTGRSLTVAVEEQAGGARVLGEPQARNSAPCIYWAARLVAEQDPHGVMMVMSSDHYVSKPEAFRQTVQEAAARAAEGRELVTLGVKPSRPETGYGYLKLGDRLGGNCRRVQAFVEKPDRARAEAFVRSGEYLWNGGMFLWRADTVLAAFDKHMPELRAAWDHARGNVDEAFPKMTATSIDFGLMEKAEQVVTFPLDCGWDDLGSWTSLEALAAALGAQRPGGVVTHGETVAIESTGNIVDAPGKLVALLGVSNLIVAQNGDALLIASKDRAQEIRGIVDLVKIQRPELA